MKITITKRICLLVFVCILSITTLAQADLTINILPASMPSLELEEVSNDFFTVSLPNGSIYHEEPRRTKDRIDRLEGNSCRKRSRRKRSFAGFSQEG